MIFFYTVLVLRAMLEASCLTVRCGLSQRGVYWRTLPLIWGKHTPGELFFFLTRQLAASHQLRIKTEAICNQQLLIGGGELMGLLSIIQRLHVSEKGAQLGFPLGRGNHTRTCTRKPAITSFWDHGNEWNKPEQASDSRVWDGFTALLDQCHIPAGSSSRVVEEM